jgi:predicted AAA+ superfamily ATPase
MEATLSRLIADFHEKPLPDLTPRAARWPRVPGKINVVTGMRRAGKTFFCYQAMRDLLSEGVEKTRLLYLNFEDERLLPLGTEELRLIPEVYYRMFPAHKKLGCHFFFDEIQRIEGWDSFVRRIGDGEKVSIALTGSSSKLLSSEISTRLRGRSLTTELFPFDFLELLRFHGVKAPFDGEPGSAAIALFESWFEKYLLSGGFPEVQRTDEEIARQILHGNVDVVILRDIVERHGISNVLPLRYMIRHLVNAPATRLSVNKFYNTLRSLSVQCTKNSLYEYMGHLEEAYLAFAVPLHTRSERARLVNPRKVYLIDNGLIGAMSRKPTPDLGALLENLVFLTLRRAGSEIEYYLDEGGTEVDFVVTPRKGPSFLVQVCWTLKKPETSEREIRALERAMGDLGLRRATVVTAFERKTLKTPRGDIEVVPAWDWLRTCGLSAMKAPGVKIGSS